MIYDLWFLMHASALQAYDKVDKDFAEKFNNDLGSI